MKESVKKFNRIVIKIGSSLFFSKGLELDESLFHRLVNQISKLTAQGKEVVVVSSGAIALGMQVLGLKSRPKELSYLQASAAIGQNLLMDYYSSAFQKNKINCAQILLTWDDFDDRKRYLNAKNTINTLLKLKSVPVINENDTVSIEEIKFGDNDKLSARVASLISADLLIILSDVEGLLDGEGKVVRVVDEITAQVKSLACPTQKQSCVGGMITKIEAAKIAVDSGIPCVIANGRKDNIIVLAVQNLEENGTLFVPNKSYLSLKKRWIAFGTKSKGKIIVDDGAKKALVNKKSLLSVGVFSVEGNFESNDIVKITDKHGDEFARGKVSLSSKQLDKIKGVRSDKEVIHCDNIVILS